MSVDYKNAVQSAEEAVSGMKDPKLKEIAFGQILDQLLSGGKARHEPKERESHTAPKSPARAAGGKRKSGTIDWLRELVAEGFFKKPQNQGAILLALEERSHHLVGSDLVWAMRQLCHTKILRRKKIAPAEGKAAVWHWSNW